MADKPVVNVLQELLAKLKAEPPVFNLTPVLVDRKINFKCDLTCMNRSVSVVGSSKKEVRRLSAENMLELLKDLSVPLKNNNIKQQQTTESNPVGYLQEYCIANAICLPKYDFEVENSLDIRPKFKAKCTCNGLTTEGEGNSKKISKKAAAAAMLALVEGNQLLIKKEAPNIDTKTTGVNGSSNGEIVNTYSENTTSDTKRKVCDADNSTQSKRRKN